jgi:RNA polymerase sigma-70 factor, ECF subfamily
MTGPDRDASPDSTPAGRVPSPGPAPPDPARTREREQLAALRRGDQAAFAELVRRLHPSMVRLATSYVSSRALAEEVAQDTWVAVLEELDRFEGRSSLRTWMFRILVNKAKTRGVRERRSMPFSSLSLQQEAAGPMLPPESFFDDDHRWAGHWAVPVHAWELPEEHLLSTELAGVILQAVDGLPPAQRAVVALRDGQSLPSQEVCDLLGLTEANQRVLLHRGRTRVRSAIAAYAERTGVGV